MFGKAGSEITCEKCGYMRIFYYEQEFMRWNGLHAQNCGGKLKRESVIKDFNDVPLVNDKGTSSMPANVCKLLKETGKI